jgi:hypothetical protein
MLGKKKNKVIWKKNPTTIFIQLLRAKTIEKTNKVKKTKKEEKRKILP